MQTKSTLVALLTIGLIAAVFGGATYAVFSDTEESAGNQMIAGTIDFSVDGQNPWDDISWSKDLLDMKPCETQYGDFEITNVGKNPMNLWKKLDNYVEDDGTMTEPECHECGGTTVYDPETEVYTCVGNYDENCDLSAFTIYDMKVIVTDADGGIIRAEDELIIESDNVLLDDVFDLWMYLGVLEPGHTMTVTQSYHLGAVGDNYDYTVTNWAQVDILTFDVTLYGEQIVGDAVGPTNPDGGLDDLYTYP